MVPNDNPLSTGLVMSDVNQRTGSGLYIPETTKKKASAVYQQKAQEQRTQLAMRLTRSERRSIGNKRARCPRCEVPVKTKNFIAHLQRLHPEALQQGG